MAKHMATQGTGHLAARTVARTVPYEAEGPLDRARRTPTAPRHMAAPQAAAQLAVRSVSGTSQTATPRHMAPREVSRAPRHLRAASHVAPDGSAPHDGDQPKTNVSSPADAGGSRAGRHFSRARPDIGEDSHFVGGGSVASGEGAIEAGEGRAAAGTAGSAADNASAAGAMVGRGWRTLALVLLVVSLALLVACLGLMRATGMSLVDGISSLLPNDEPGISWGGTNVGAGVEEGADVPAGIPAAYEVGFDALGMVEPPDSMRLGAEWIDWPWEAGEVIGAFGQTALVDKLRSHLVTVFDMTGALPYWEGSDAGRTIRPAGRLDSLPTLKVEGFELLGWRVDGEGRLLGLSDGRPIAVLSDVTLVAQWRTLSEVPEQPQESAVVPMERLEDELTG